MHLPNLLTTATSLTVAQSVLQTRIIGSSDSSSTPKLSTSRTIKLVAHITSSSDALGIDTYEANPFPLTDHCTNVLGYSPPGYGATFTFTASTTLLTPLTYRNGTLTTGGLTYNTSGGTSTVPASVPVTADCDAAGTLGISVVTTDDGYPIVEFGGATTSGSSSSGGGWMACPAATLGTRVGGDEGAVLVGVRRSGQRLLSGCEEVVFVTFCAEGDAEDGENEDGVAVDCVVAEDKE
ncbi:hypothetical protein B0J12DRAFT_72453 [Macrophomina phaseolina]|uniref:Uncharacterized protein n=1 Tax=Macrophomina phaseolina TaxID=35725 RepID=A0ABQ8GGF7_9PEZI|nr:hypothetical protein B0J12DRAFT_72453 [Macrophomina phaseolina]